MSADRFAGPVGGDRPTGTDSADRFGAVHGYAGGPLPAPPMPTSQLKPRGRVR